MTMIKKVAVVCSTILLALSLGGCWSYHSLDEMNIITGIAIDVSKTGEYELTFEVLDITGPVRYQGISTVLLQSRGATIYDAVRNAEKKITGRLYYGHMEVVVLSEEIARSRDISGIIDWFLRDQEPRETLSIIISQEETARELFSVKGVGTRLVSLEITKIIELDHRVTLSIPVTELYKIFDIIKEEGVSLTLPVFHIAKSGGEAMIEVGGTAVYQGEKMVGRLTPQESKYYLFVAGEVERGPLTFPSSGEGSDDTTLDISKNSTIKSFTFENGKLKIHVKTETDVVLNEYKPEVKEIDLDRIKALEATAANCLARRIGDVIKKMQTEYQSDIFGFGEMIHDQNPGLWKQFKDNWNETFASLDIEVQSKVNLINTGALME